MLRLEPRPAPSRAMSLLSPVLALAVTVAIGIALFALLGKDPARGLAMFFVEPFRGAYAVSELCVKATPLMLIGLGLAVCYRANVWNIGAEGQFVLGAIAATWVALRATPDSGHWIVVPILLAGVLGGMAWAAVVAFLRDRANASEILVSLMLVYVAVQLLNWLVYGTWKDPEGYNFPQTITFLDATKIPRLLAGLRLNIGFPLALLAVGAFWLYLFRAFVDQQAQARDGQDGAGVERGRQQECVGVHQAAGPGVVGCAACAGFQRRR